MRMANIEAFTRFKVPPTRGVAIAPALARWLVNQGDYRESLGWPPGGEHFRRALRDGSGLHVVITGNAAAIHWDRHDPQVRWPEHIVQDALGETCLTLFGAWLVWKGLSTLLA